MSKLLKFNLTNFSFAHYKMLKLNTRVQTNTVKYIFDVLIRRGGAAFFLLFLACQSEPPPAQPAPFASALSELVPGFPSAPPPFDSTKTSPQRIVRNVYHDRAGILWIAAFDGMFTYDGTRFERTTAGTRSTRFFDVQEDRTGILWAASVGEGIFRYDGRAFRRFTTRDGLVNDRVTNIYEDSTDGRLWFGTEGGLSIFDGTSFRNYTVADGLLDHDVNAVLRDQTGRYWIATRGFAQHFDGTRFTKITDATGRGFGNVRHLIQDRHGNIWLAGQQGLWRYDGVRFTQISAAMTGYVFEDRRGAIWTSAETTVAGAWQLSCYTDQSDFTNRKIITEDLGMLFGIEEDASGNLWFGTLRGVCRYDGTQVVCF